MRFTVVITFAHPRGENDQMWRIIHSSHYDSRSLYFKFLFKTIHQWHNSYIFNINTLHVKTTFNLRPIFLVEWMVLKCKEHSVYHFPILNIHTNQHYKRSPVTCRSWQRRNEAVVVLGRREHKCRCRCRWGTARPQKKHLRCLGSCSQPDVRVSGRGGRCRWCRLPHGPTVSTAWWLLDHGIWYKKT